MFKFYLMALILKNIYIIIIIIIQTLKALVSHFYLFNIFSLVLIAFKVYIQENILVILFSLKLFYFPKTNAFFFLSEFGIGI